MGDMIHAVYLDCGHIDQVVLRNANKRPCWMVADVVPQVGAKGECPFCHNNSTVIEVKLLRGWGDA